MRRVGVTAAVALVLALALWAALAERTRRSALWRILSESCVPAAQQSGQGTGRCAEVSLAGGPARGHAVLKDRQGALQYLVMPLRKSTGIEDVELLSPEAPNLWAVAWRARRWMEVSRGAAVTREAVSITVNSFWGRSQNQLHLHVSCVRPDLKAVLETLAAAWPDVAADAAWVPLAGGWLGHPYEVRQVLADDLDDIDVFKEAARGRSAPMARLGLAAVATRFHGRDGFWLLRTQVDARTLWQASIEQDVQDHACRILRGR